MTNNKQIINYQITYKWKLPAGRLQAEAEFEDSHSKSIKNEYVKLEPRPKEIFKMSDALTMESSVQVGSLCYKYFIK